MKFAKKLMSVLLVVLMLVTMALPAMADGEPDPATCSLIINHDHDGHTYEAYQIFKGTLSGNVLSSIEWGNGVKHDTEDFLNALETVKRENVAVLAGLNGNAKLIASEIGRWSFNDAALKSFADVVGDNLSGVTSGICNYSTSEKCYKITGLEPGYYLVRDTSVPVDSTKTDYLLGVTREGMILNPKFADPTLTKTVNNEEGGTYVEAMDAQVGDTIYFKLESKIPNLIHDYKQFSLIFEDTIPECFKNLDLVSVYLSHSAGGTTLLTLNTHYESVIDGNKITVTLHDLPKTYNNLNANDTVVVKYNAVFNPADLSKVVIGNGDSVGTTSKGNVAGTGNYSEATLKFTNDMNQDEDTLEGVSKSTITDGASVYTYGAEITKINTVNGSPLKNAKFVLYRVVNGVKRYALIDANGLIIGDTTEMPDANLISDDNGKFEIYGLDGLLYHLEEVTPPEGFNKMDAPVDITLKGTYGNDHKLSTLVGTVDGVATNGDKAKGVINFEVRNTPGSVLPATGGMGTTIFYIAGAVLLLGSITAFAVKKRGEN